MAENKPGIFTFHKVREQCEQANADAWRAFLEMYAPLGMHLLAMYAPEGVAADSAFAKTLSALVENHFERFRATERQSEREFLADVRALLLGTITEATPASEATQENPASNSNLTTESSRRCSKGCRCCIRRCCSSSWPVTLTPPSS